MNNSIKIEMCCGSVDSVNKANKFQVDRIELCQNLEQGGITPSPGLFFYAKEKEIETHVLIRTRVGDFFYTKDEKKTMLKDIEFFLSNKADGIVIGALKKNYSIDEDFLDELKQFGKAIDFTFHRAFDEIIDWKNAMDILIELGWKRILSAGRASKIPNSIPFLNQMIEYAEGKLEIMPGGGINPENVQDLMAKTKISSIHFSGTTEKIINKNSIFESKVLAVNENKTRRILESIRRTI